MGWKHLFIPLFYCLRQRGNNVITYAEACLNHICSKGQSVKRTRTFLGHFFLAAGTRQSSLDFLTTISATNRLKPRLY